jgi:hypothetical protein
LRTTASSPDGRLLRAIKIIDAPSIEIIDGKSVS